ncbi:MAG TPA: hypothetical protein VKA13_02580, partial [Gammaproteobacteria bacterium]|nr:hypothetical protein [Gammaproteobacteria bacterium]
GVFRARENTASKELWFAAYRPAGAGGKHDRPLKVRLPGAHGVVINLASGRREPVDGGVFELPVGDDATPYYFSPSARDGG